MLWRQLFVLAKLFGEPKLKMPQDLSFLGSQLQLGSSVGHSGLPSRQRWHYNPQSTHHCSPDPVEPGPTGIMYVVTMDFSHVTIGPEAARPVTWEVWSVKQAILMVSFSPTGSYSLIKQCCSTLGGASIAHKHSRLPPHPWCLSSSPLPWSCASPNTGITECQSLLTVLNLNIHLSKWFSYWHKLEINEFFFIF